MAIIFIEVPGSYFTKTAMVQIDLYNNFANNLQAIKMPYMVYFTIVCDYSCDTEIYFMFTTHCIFRGEDDKVKAGRFNYYKNSARPCIQLKMNSGYHGYKCS